MIAPRTFVDTNVLVYRLDVGEPIKRARAREVIDQLAGRMVISTQVLGEFFVTITRKMQPATPAGLAADMVADLSRQPVVRTDAQLVRAAIETSQRSQISYWDALIVEAAVTGGCSRILTEDLGAGSVIRGVEIVDPFA